MTQTAPERTPVAKPAGPKIAGIDRRTATIFGVALLGGVAYFLYKRKSSSSTAANASSGTPCTDSAGNAGTYDASGNCVATTAAGAGVDYSGQLSVIQTELETMMAAQSGDTAPDTTGTTTPPPSGNPGGPPTGTTTTLATPKALSVTKLNRAGNQASAQFAWDAVTGATNYTCTVYLGSNNKAVTGPFMTNGPLANAGNLKPQTSYRVCVNANASGTAGPKSCMYFRTH